MFNATTGRKSNLFRVGLILALLLALSSIAMPVGATPPEDVHFDISVTYYNLPSDVGTGMWSASGLFAGSGDAIESPNHSGWDPDGCWRAVHATTTLTDPITLDTITVRAQITKIVGEPGCSSFSARANWVILSGTGAYTELHGQGGGTVTGYLDFNGGVNYVVNYDLNGQAHFR